MILLWWAVVRVFGIESFILPTPFEALYALFKYFPVLLHHIFTTFVTTVLGFGLAVILGALLGVLVGSFRIVYSALYPILIGFNSVPKAALVPVLVIWCGVGPLPAVFTAFLLSFFPIVVNVATGFATVEPELFDVLRALGAARRDMIVKIGITRSLPNFFAALKI
jgi:NitT/TauT family transport system permease protein